MAALELLYNAEEDCKAIIQIFKNERPQLSDLGQNARSIESVNLKSTNPLLKSGLITEMIAQKLPNQITCKDKLDMTDNQVTNQVTNLLLENGVRQASIVICLEKRRQHIAEVQ